LDYRYGAGQLNVFNSYNIIAGGEQDSGAVILESGYDIVESYGSENEVSIYSFATLANPGKLIASLVWHLNVNSSEIIFTPAPILYDLNIELVDVTTGAEVLIASSTSSIDNTENIWFDLLPYRSYELRVSHQHGSAFSWPYALAWRADFGSQPDDTRQIPFAPGSLLGALIVFVIALTATASRQRC
ncbi:MAG: hypothetical protein AAF387_07655, partial [Pseudomonadota bacterium]